MVKFDDADGVWRTVGGRRIFIKTGQDLASAMKESGKFNNKKDHTFNMSDEDKRKYEEVGKKIDDLTKEIDEKNKITDREIRQLKTQKSLKDLVESGRAKDITTFDDDKSRELHKQHGRLEVIKVTRGTYGMNGALLQSRETGEYFVITARNSNLFYWV